MIILCKYCMMNKRILLYSILSAFQNLKMSQSFARTTTTTTTSSVFVLYTGYLKTASGLLKFAQLVCPHLQIKSIFKKNNSNYSPFVTNRSKIIRFLEQSVLAWCHGTNIWLDNALTFSSFSWLWVF